MNELLRLCGFGPSEIESESSRLEKAFYGLGITDDDIARAKQRLATYYDTELLGVRKMLRLQIRQLVDLVLAREEGKRKIIYGFMAPGIDPIGSALIGASKEIYVTSPAQAFLNVLGFIFGKLVPILQAAEMKWLKAGAVGHCAHVKLMLGLFCQDLIPKPDLLVTSGFLCETAPKTVELLSEFYDIPTYCYDGLRDMESMTDPHASFFSLMR